MTQETLCQCENCSWEGAPETFMLSWPDWIGCQDKTSPVILPEGDCPECGCPVYRKEAIAAMTVAQAAPGLLEAAEGILQWWEATPCRPAGDEPSAIIEAHTAIAKAKAVLHAEDRRSVLTAGQDGAAS